MWCCRDDNAVLMEDEAGDEFDAIGEDVFTVVDAVLFGGFEPGDAVCGFALLFTGGGVDAADVAPFAALVIIAHPAQAVGIFGGFGDPETSVGIPVDRYDLVDQGF